MAFVAIEQRRVDRILIVMLKVVSSNILEALGFDAACARDGVYVTAAAEFVDDGA